MRIGLIALDGCFGSAVASVIDIVRVADGARGDVDPHIDPIELAIVGPKRRVTTTTSMTLSVDHPLSESGDFDVVVRSEEHTSELQSLMRISYAVFCLKKKKQSKNTPAAERYTDERAKDT